MAQTPQGQSEQCSELSAVQIRMGRVALGWGVRDLAKAARISGDTVNRLERGDSVRDRTLGGVRAAMEKAGVDFLPDNGVRLRPST